MVAVGWEEVATEEVATAGEEMEAGRVVEALVGEATVVAMAAAF